MSVSLSVGSYAANAYVLEGLDLKVYSAEELCYALKENAFLLDGSLLSEKLVDWIGQELGLLDLARELDGMVRRKGSLSGFVCKILEYVGFYSPEEIGETEKTLKRGAGLSALDKQKLRVDQLLSLHKYAAAVKEYDALLKVWEEHGDVSGGASFKSALFHNQGVAYTGLMRYEEAAESFLSAYETDGNAKSLRSFLSAKRLILKEGEYVDYVAARPEWKETVMELEQILTWLNQDRKKEEGYRKLEDRKNLRAEDEGAYREETRRLLCVLREECREMITVQA